MLSVVTTVLVVVGVVLSAVAVSGMIYFGVVHTRDIQTLRDDIPSVKDGAVGQTGATGPVGTCMCEKAQIFRAFLTFNGSDTLNFTNPGINIFVKINGSTTFGRIIEEDTAVTVGDIHWDSSLEQINIASAGIVTVKAAFTWQREIGGSNNFGFGIQINNDAILEYNNQRSSIGNDWTVNSYSANLFSVSANTTMQFFIRNTEAGVGIDWIVGGVSLVVIEHL